MAATRVHLVEDNGPLRELTRILLEGSGHFQVVGQSTNGLDAVDDAARIQPDLILLDLVMPVLSGFDALPRLRRVAPGAVVIALSMLSHEKAARRAFALGAHGFIDKGTPDEDLADAILNVFHQARLPAGAKASVTATL